MFGMEFKNHRNVLSGIRTFPKHRPKNENELNRDFTWTEIRNMVINHNAEHDDPHSQVL